MLPCATIQLLSFKAVCDLEDIIPVVNNTSLVVPICLATFLSFHEMRVDPKLCVLHEDNSGIVNNIQRVVLP